MTALYDKLNPILLLEKRQNCADRAVAGGLQGFLDYWRDEVASLPPEAAERANAEVVLSLLRGYRHMSPAERCVAVDQVLARLADEPPAGSTGPSRSEGRAAAAPRARTRRPTAPRATLASPLTVIKGVGARNQEYLERLGLRTVEDLLYYLPRRYDDFSRLKTVSRLVLGEEATVVGTVRKVYSGRARGGLPVVAVSLADDTGPIEARWFGQPFLARQFRPGDQVVFSGRVDQYRGRLFLNGPEWEPLQPELLHTGRLVPVYPLTRGLGARRLRTLVREAIDRFVPQVVDRLPEGTRRDLDLMGLQEALQQIHFPDSLESLAIARRRLCFDEFLLLQLGVLGQRRQWSLQAGIPLEPSRAGIDAFAAGLPFRLTAAQQRAVGDILADLGRHTPMRRLLQGDVGSGKTVVAVAALLATVRNGYQAAVMAPTGILAEQHYQTITSMLAACPDVHCVLLTGAVPAAEKERIRAAAATGEPQVLIGTHALIQESVSLPRLAVMVVDEQHRFGVTQRTALAERGEALPHILAMSATPIPRSLAMTIYGDLDVSVLDELPAGRQPVITAVRDDGDRERIYAFMTAEVAAGRQCFVVCPRIDESDEAVGKSAVAEHRRLSKSVFRRQRLGLLHGRMSGEEKEQAMAAFKQGAVDILVSTTVIEVGIDIPNASVMLIESAGRFGLAQLHQLRGRVGRGESKSYCILLADEDSDAASERLRIMEQTADGFALAEEDLRMRGPGDFFGVRQHGLPSLKVAQLGDTTVLEQARREAARLVADDPELARPEHAALCRDVRRFWASDEVVS